VVSNGGSGAKAAVAAAVAENKKLVASNSPNAGNPAGSQARGSNPQTSAGGSNLNPAGPIDGGSMEKPTGDFTLALITNLYHKHREALLKAVEDVMGD
jgi:hypothetical protein